VELKAKKREVKTTLHAKRLVKIEYSLSHKTDRKMHKSQDIFYKKKSSSFFTEFLIRENMTSQVQEWSVAT
jgi:hypothetical protein